MVNMNGMPKTLAEDLAFTQKNLEELEHARSMPITNEHYYESTLEQALIDHLQKFLLELGRGFSFVGRQKHFNIYSRHFYIDSIFLDNR